jgi:hypothetical protein
MPLLHSGKLNYYCIIIICGIEKMSLYEYRRHPYQSSQREMSVPVSEVRDEGYLRNVVVTEISHHYLVYSVTNQDATVL